MAHPKTIGILLPHLNAGYDMAILDGAHAIARQQGVQLIAVWGSPGDLRAHSLAANQIAGWIAVLNIPRPESIRDIVRAGMPLVVIGALIPDLGCPAVLPDNYGGTRAEARHLEDACAGESVRDLRDRALLVFMLGTGVRSAEALGLQVEDLSTIDGHTVAWVLGKGGIRERVKIAPRVQKLLRAYLATAEITDGSIFRRVRRVLSDPTVARSPLIYRVYEPLSYAGLKFILRSRFAAAELSAHLSPHSLRHSFITLAIRGGATLAQVQAAARHADPRTTMRYVHGMDDLDNNAVDYVNW